MSGGNSLGARFEQVARAMPQAPAVICHGNTYSFATLSNLANRAARWLASRGLARGDVACLELPKRIEAYALAIACLKLGAPYVFLDPDAPAERAQRMLERCRPRIVVSTRPGPGERVVCSGEADWQALHTEFDRFDDAGLPETLLVTGTDPAYVMFTSGSTGEPKGAVIPHQGVLHLAAWAASDLAIGPADRLTNVNPLHFDNSVFDIYASLLNGAAVVSLEALKGRPPAALLAAIQEHGCTFFFAVPTLFMFLESMQLLRPDALPTVTRFMFGGEGYPLKRLRRFHDSFTGRARLINCYGPTETSCICSAHEITEEVFDSDDQFASLGRLNPNFSHRILDADLQPVGAGEAGELWLGGPGVGLGYLNNPEETARKFRQDPLIAGYRAFLYRSGDLVEEHPQTGQLRFRGRADNQVKLRGYRVELEEIDHALATIPGVTRALTVLVQGAQGAGRLVAAYSGERLSAGALISACRRLLPEYMIPSRFVWLEALPLNANGKADRRGLAVLLAERIEDGATS